MDLCLRLAVLLLSACAGAMTAESLYTIQPFAGSEYGGDGRPALEAPLVQPQGLAMDIDGTIVFADAGDHRVRRILPNGFVSTLAGDGFPGNGTRLRTPYGIAIGPNREIYVADLGNGRVVRLNSDGTRKEIASLQQPRNLATDANGVLYISDFAANRVYRVKSDGALEWATAETLNGPAGLAIDATGTLYIADSGNQRVIAIKNGTLRTVLKDFGYVTSIAVDRGGRLYAAGGDRVAVVATSGELTILNTPATEVALDSYGSLLTVAYRQVRSYRMGSTTVLAGSGFGSYTGDGRPREEWRFVRPNAVTRDQSGNLYIADSGNGRIRRIDADGKLSTLTTALGDPTDVAVDGLNRLYFTDSKDGLIYRIELDGTAKVFSRGGGGKLFSKPSGIAIDSHGNVYVADTGNGLIRKLGPDGFVSTIAGGGSTDQDGFGLAIGLNRPAGITVASDGTVWFTEPTRVRSLSPDGRVRTIPGVPLVDARGLHLDDQKRLLIADAGANRVLRVKADGSWEPIAGSGERGFSGDGSLALQATFDGPTDVWPEADGSILVCDSGNNRIRRLSVEKAVAAPIVNANIRVLHAGTGKEQAIAPGQLAIIEAAEPFPSMNMDVQFGDALARVVSATPTRLTVIVPPVLPPGLAQVAVGDWGSAPVEIAAAAPAFSSAIENGDGTLNALDNPTPRTGTIKVTIAGEGIATDPPILAEVAGIGLPVVSAERSAGLFVIVLQLPGGFLPSGSTPLALWVNSVKVSGALNVVIR